QRRELINGVFTDINPYIKNMMYVLADNRHISLIADVFKAFQRLYNGHYNPDLIGGFRVKVGTTVLDGSVRNDLVQLQRKFRRVN
ncbi:F0F1 ATP synthase subunit delta, partial [Staphylococcus aureus]|nr:F0F1 ATP synthase subunit delta [Staphylococcus aureus]